MKGKRNLKLLKALGIAPCGCVQDERCETHSDPEKFPLFPPDKKGKRRKVRQAWVAFHSDDSPCATGATQGEAWRRAQVMGCSKMALTQVIEVREVPRRKRK